MQPPSWKEEDADAPVENGRQTLLTCSLSSLGLRLSNVPSQHPDAQHAALPITRLKPWQLKQRSTARCPPGSRLSSGPEARSPAALPLPSPPAPLPALLYTPAQPHSNSLRLNTRLTCRPWLPKDGAGLPRANRNSRYYRRLKKPAGKRDKLKGLSAGTLFFLVRCFLSFCFSQASESKAMLTVCHSSYFQLWLNGHHLRRPTWKRGKSSCISGRDVKPTGSSPCHCQPKPGMF